MSAPASSLPTAPSAPVVSVPMSCPLIPAGSSMVLTCAFMRVFSLVNNSSAASHLRRCRVVSFESPPILIQSQLPADKSPDKEQAEGLHLFLVRLPNLRDRSKGSMLILPLPLAFPAPSVLWRSRAYTERLILPRTLGTP